MKLIYRLTIRLSVILSLIFGIWAIFFYVAIMREINDEVDDMLEDQSEQIIIRFLGGDEIPYVDIHSNNQYYLQEVAPEYANRRTHMIYQDSMVYIPHKNETEPARILKTIYKDKNGKFYELVILTPTIEKQDLKRAIFYWTVFLYLGLLLVILFVNIWVYQRVHRPLYKLLTWLDEYRVGQKNHSLKNDTNIIEFRKLNEAAIRTMRHTEAFFEEQKQFIENVSHELQTPLSVCRNRIENLMEEDTFSFEQLQELTKIYTTLEYVTKLNKTILLLSKIYNWQFSDTVPVELNGLIRKLIPDYEEVYSYMYIHTNIKEKGICIVQMNEMLASILINNLIKNAYVHNVKNGQLKIDIFPSKVVFKNTGQKQPLDPTLIFERFYQGSKKQGVAGLGLSLVKSISDMQKLTVSYYFRDSFHCFEITF